MKNHFATGRQLAQQSFVGDVPFDKFQLITRLAPVKIGQAARGKIVEHNQLGTAPAESLHQMRADETGSTRDENFHASNIYKAEQEDVKFDDGQRSKSDVSSCQI